VYLIRINLLILIPQGIIFTLIPRSRLARLTRSESSNTNTNTNPSNIQLESEKYYPIRKDFVDKGVEIISKGVEQGVEKVVANVGAFAGTAAAAVLKSNLPTGPQIAIAAASALVVGASTKIVIAIGESVVTRSKGNPSTYF
jgi:hypothetical protein